MDISSERVGLSTGVVLHVVRGPGRTGPPVLLLPAYADAWSSWIRLMPLLGPDVDIISADPRGHGDSERPACCYRVDDHAADFVALLDALAIPKAIVAGHSGSCFAARRMAVAHPDRVAGLVLIASPVKLDPERLGTFIEAVRRLPDPVPEPFVRDLQSAAVHAEIPRVFLDRVVADAGRMPARVWRAELEGLLAFRDDRDLAAIAAPTTLLWGDRDSIVPSGEQERLAMAIPNARLVVLPDVGHSPHWEQPGEVARIVLEVARHALDQERR